MIHSVDHLDPILGAARCCARVFSYRCHPAKMWARAVLYKSHPAYMV